MRLDVHQAEMARIAVRAQHIRGEKSVGAINDHMDRTIVRVDSFTHRFGNGDLTRILKLL
jgi:hypothetical protein